MKRFNLGALAGVGALAGLAVAGAPAQADTYQVNYTGVVTSVYNPQGLLDATIMNGTAVNASTIFQYPAQATQITANVAAYLFSGAPGAVTATFGDYLYTPTAASRSGFLVGNDLGFCQPATDFVLYGSEGGLLSNATGTAPSLTGSAFSTQLIDPSGTALASDSLPTSYRLGAFPIHQLQFGGMTGGQFGGFDATLLSVSVKDLTSATPTAVPEPAPGVILLFGAVGVGGLVAFRRRRAQTA